MSEKLLLIVGCAGLVGCADAGASETLQDTPAFGPLLVAVDSVHHVACYARHPWQSQPFQCFPLDSTNSRVIVR